MCSEQKQPVVVVSAVMRRDGCPDFALNVAEVTEDEKDNGIHYYLVEADLLQAGFEEPFVHFAAEESPAFLHPAVRHYLSSSPIDSQPHHVARPEGSPCRA